jgi:hypothetical protein
VPGVAAQAGNSRQALALCPAVRPHSRVVGEADSKGVTVALSQKGARRLVLDGVAYRWRVRRRPAYSQALGWTPLIYAVEHADEPGTVLVVTTGRPHPSSLFGHNAAPVLPSDVAAAIKLAL